MKYYIWVLGCSMNNSDAERVSTVLELLGYKKTELESEADLIITVACSVRQSAINRIYGSAVKWKRLKTKRPNLKTILTGCVLETDRKKLSKVFDVMFEIEDLGKLPGILGAELAEEKVDSLGQSGEYLAIAPAYDSRFRAYVPIMTGCNNFCSYCAVPYTRGREVSRPEAEILKEVELLVGKGYKEITLLGQNVNSYNSNVKLKTQNTKNQFAGLLKRIDKIPGDYRIYFYSNHPKDMSEELIETLPILEHFPAYIHLPLQSGSNKVIKEMNRHYTKEQYLKLVRQIRAKLPEVTLTTDVIVGYPGETEKDFEDTKEVMEKSKFDMAFIAQYSPRPGTKSAQEDDDVSEDEKKRRDLELNEILAKTALKNNKKLVGSNQRVLMDGKKSGKLYGRTEGYKVVEITSTKLSTRKNDQSLEIGQFVDVKIVSADSWKLVGELI